MKIPDFEKSGGSDLFFLENLEIRGVLIIFGIAYKSACFALNIHPISKKFSPAAGCWGVRLILKISDSEKIGGSDLFLKNQPKWPGGSSLRGGSLFLIAWYIKNKNRFSATEKLGNI